MDRRTKQRIDLQLLGRLGKHTVQGKALEGTTENISRDGILMRWSNGVPLPELGSELMVEFMLPASEGFGQRVMRCRTTVVRIDESSDGKKSVAMRIDGMNFTPASENTMDLQSMPAATERIN